MKSLFLVLIYLIPGLAGSDDASAPVRCPVHSQAANRAPGRITAAGADRVRLGMTGEQLLAAYGARARRAAVSREGMAEPIIEVRDADGRPLLMADLTATRISRIHVRSPRLATPRGARVGTPFRTLERLYGQGQVLVGEGNVCVTFPRTAPGLSFCLANAYRLVTAGRLPSWSRLRRANPRVETILVVGKLSAVNVQCQNKQDNLVRSWCPSC